MRTFCKTGLLALIVVFLSNMVQSQRVPRIRFARNQFPQMTTAVFTETLNDTQRRAVGSG